MPAGLRRTSGPGFCSETPIRLAGSSTDPKRPVQIIFAGKAHPRDDAGKDLIRQVSPFQPGGAIPAASSFIEQYDTTVARYLVQGADVWLNNPRRPQEASGTSGMKAAANGVLNLSTLDGWWDEAWRSADADMPPIGWAIGRGEEYESADYQDQVEAEALYDLLEQDVVPTFYDRAADGLPRQWIARMKSSLEQLSAQFNTDRMVRDYTEQAYLPSHTALPGADCRLQLRGALLRGRLECSEPGRRSGWSRSMGTRQRKSRPVTDLKPKWR